MLGRHQAVSIVAGLIVDVYLDRHVGVAFLCAENLCLVDLLAKVEVALPNVGFAHGSVDGQTIGQFQTDFRGNEALVFGGLARHIAVPSLSEIECNAQSPRARILFVALYVVGEWLINRGIGKALGGSDLRFFQMEESKRSGTLGILLAIKHIDKAAMS